MGFPVWWLSSAALIQAVTQGPRLVALTLLYVLSILSIQLEEGEREEACRFMWAVKARPGMALSLLPFFHWPELSHMAPLNSKGGWEM